MNEGEIATEIMKITIIFPLLVIEACERLGIEIFIIACVPRLYPYGNVFLQYSR